MDSNIQHTLLSLEITPPEGLWEKIAGELDDAASGFQFPNRLYSLNDTPPAAAWEKITQQLDEEQTAATLAKKLFIAEAEPPSTAWNKITKALDAEKEAALPEKRQLSPLLKYAAAAAVIGFMVWGGLQVFKPVEQQVNSALNPNSIPAAEIVNHANAGLEDASGNKIISHPEISEEQAAKEDAALEASKKTYSRLDMPRAKKTGMASAFRFSNYMNADDISMHNNAGYEEALTGWDIKPDRYILLMTPDGHLIRMSKKLSSLVCCVSGEEQDNQCRTQVDKWRKQLACSEASHAGNFMDILSLVGSLKDN
jgi:hypothetical protein